QDPGNLGTILRVADWFGIGNIFCDADCAGVYNPKCVQASMGAIFRVKTFYTDLSVLLSELKQEGLPVFGTFLDGKNIYTTALSTRGLIVMGNEGKGISAEIEALTGQKLTIPSFARNSESTESLNVGVATGIILSE
ncbi:MAG TPA: RNA methyltransferase, partial [Odoribacter splanchnicus]|nr:RNA methyltransferase [Odoribacter splanchnicus]